MAFMISAIVVRRLNCVEIPIEGSVMSSVDVLKSLLRDLSCPRWTVVETKFRQ